MTNDTHGGWMDVANDIADDVMIDQWQIRYFMPDQINIMVPGRYFPCGGRLMLFKSAECVDGSTVTRWIEVKTI